ncbi:hypothetical protein J6590_044024 [Homalodisca vitripennis]|nr:hypothetical protein J6590_044024 [Homalodisca vitripennis]
MLRNTDPVLPHVTFRYVLYTTDCPVYLLRPVQRLPNKSIVELGPTAHVTQLYVIPPHCLLQVVDPSNDCFNHFS